MSFCCPTLVPHLHANLSIIPQAIGITSGMMSFYVKHCDLSKESLKASALWA